MTYALAAQAQQITRLTPAQKIVLMHLCQVANEGADWKVWHSQAQIAFLEGLSRRTVVDALAKLEDQKLIRTGKFASEMLGRNVYQVDRKRVELMAKADALEAEEKVREWKEKHRNQMTQIRQAKQIRASLKVIEWPVDNQDSA